MSLATLEIINLATASGKQSKQIGVRLGLDTFSNLEKEAKELEISPTSRTRQIIEDHFGFEASIIPRAAARTPKHPAATSGLKEIASSLGGLLAAQVKLREVLECVRQLRSERSLETEAFVQTSLARIQSDLSIIKQVVLRAAR